MALTYASHPHIVEEILSFAGRETLLSARETCSSLQAFADRELAGDTVWFNCVGGGIAVTTQQGVWEPDLPPLSSLSLKSDATPGQDNEATEEQRKRLPCFYPFAVTPASASARARTVSRAAVVVLVDIPPSPALDALLANVQPSAHVVILHAQHSPAPMYTLPAIRRLTISLTPNCLCGMKLGVGELGRRWAQRSGSSSGSSKDPTFGQDSEGRKWWDDSPLPKGSGTGELPRLRHEASTVHLRLTRPVADPVLGRASYTQLCAGLPGALSPSTQRLILELQGSMPEPVWDPESLLPLPSTFALSSDSDSATAARKAALNLRSVEIVARGLPDFEAATLFDRLRARMRRGGVDGQEHVQLRRRFAECYGLEVGDVTAREMPRCQWKRLHGQPEEVMERCPHCSPLPGGLEGVIV